MSQSSFFPIPESQLGGAVAVNVFAFLSTVALISVALRVIWLAIRHFWLKSSGESQESVFFHTQLGQYAACLIISMIFNTFAGIIGIGWLVKGGITEGFMCRSQATLMQIGNFAAGYFTVSIAVHTFNSLVLRKRQSAFICRTTILIGWLLSVLIAAIPYMITLSEGPVYGPDGLLCDIRTIYPKLQFFFHLLPIFLASIFGAVLYSVIFLALRGTLKLNGGIKLSLNPRQRWDNSQGLGENYQRFILRVAKSMLWYPVAYIALLVPYAVMRLLVISGFVVPFEAMVFAFVCWYSLSVVDVLLLYNTFRVLGPAFDGHSTVASRSMRKELDSFGSSGSLDKSDGSSQRSPMNEKIDIYRSQGGLPYRSSSPTPSAKSTQGLLPMHHERSDHGFTGLQSPARVPITPATPNYVISSPLPVAQPTFGGRELSQQIYGLSDSPTASPRRVPQSPITSGAHALRQSPTQASNTDHRESTQNFGRQSPSRIRSWVSEEEIDAFGSQQRRDISGSPIPQSPYGRSLMGAFNSPFAQQVPNPRSPPTSANIDRRSPQASPSSSPQSGHRPLLLSRGPSLSSLNQVPNHGYSSPTRF